MTTRNSTDCVLVQLYLRGGADALTLCVPEDEQNYHDRRSETRVYASHDPNAPAGRRGTLIEPPVLDPQSGALVRTGFSVPPAFLPIQNLYDQGVLTFVHGVGCVDLNRSHFSQQRFTETGEHENASPKDGRGWIGRYLAGTTARGNGSLRALALSDHKITSYNGGVGATPTTTPESFDLPGGPGVRTNLQTLYASSENTVEEALTNDFGAIDKLKLVDWTTPTSTAFPASRLGTHFERTFRIIRDVPNIEVITIDFDNIDGKRWDTHVSQGVFSGDMADLMWDLSTTLEAFMANVLDPAEDCRVVVLVCTEFGRTLDENAGKGTDHGRGGLAMVLGEDVTKKQVFTHPTEWKGLQGAFLVPQNTGDQDVTIDLRDVQSEIMVKCMNVPLFRTVFPDTTYNFVDYGLLQG